MSVLGSPKSGSRQTRIALLPWGSAIEDWMELTGMTFDSLRRDVTGSWLFPYIEALQVAGLETTVIAPSRSVGRTKSFVHEPTGTRILLLKSPLLALLGKRAVARSGSLNRQYTQELTHDHRTAWRSAGMYMATPMRALAKALRAEGCEAILCQEYEYPRFDQSVLVGRLIGVPVFGVFQGGIVGSVLERPIRAVSMGACAGLIIPSSSEIRRIRERYDIEPERIAAICNPLDLESWRPMDQADARTAIDIPANARVVVWHGQVQVHRKGLDVLLDAWERICRAHPHEELVLLLVGNGRDEAELRSLISTAAVRGVRWEERFIADREVLRRFLSASDVYAFPSRREGLPSAPMEAMACGLPVVAADVGGASDILAGEESGGVLVPVGSPGALADALEGVLFGDARRRQLAERAPRRVEEIASLDAVAKRLGSFLFANGVSPSGR